MIVGGNFHMVDYNLFVKGFHIFILGPIGQLEKDFENLLNFQKIQNFIYQLGQKQMYKIGFGFVFFFSIFGP